MKETKEATTKDPINQSNRHFINLRQLLQKQKRLQKKLYEARIKINKALSSQAHVQAAIKSQTFNNRRARTRTLIQAGALLKLSDLLRICQIEEGDDLQFDMDSRDKAATLLGILLDAAQAISDPPDAGQMEMWRASGTGLLKQRAAQTVYQKMKRSS